MLSRKEPKSLFRARSRGRQRYVLVALLFFHTVNTYMDRACISAAGSSIMDELGISDQMMGYIFGIFALGYALFQVPSGWFADAYGPRKALTYVVSIWSTFTMLTGACFNALSMLTIRFLFGAGEAGAFPGATRALYKWVPVKERGLAQGIFHSGARIGAALSLFLMPFLIRLIGWRLTFVVNGLIGILWASIWWWWFRDSPKEHRYLNEAELKHIESGLSDDFVVPQKVAFGQIATSANMLLAMYQYMASNVTFFISFTWLLPYLVKHWGKGAEIYAPIPLILGTLAHWSSGSLIMYLYNKGYHVGSRRAPAVAGFTLGALGLILCTQTESIVGFIVCFSVATFGVEMTISPSWSFCMDIGGEKTGAVSASMNMLGNIGAAASAIIFPYFVANITLPYFAQETGTANSFLVFAAGMNILAVVAWLLMNPKRKFSEEMPPGRVRFKVCLFITVLILMAAAILVYKLFFMK